ncbi:site-specific DNA-cytosine methylase [Metabacillus crassostreae]|uniref:DNA cytosine methyltransferase n=1 Tax=Metabacillus crassostreae TaxID=929098 RepID=UPI001EF843ED|nr:DNA cytosine methyltransferase [Metabacillus crassostreae]MBM7604052.1 site-specific DNA-cytosine methylase [Metabacillus crassostreae]
MITAKSYLSGAGGMDLGMNESGIDVLESLEIDKVGWETLRMNFNHKVDETDITKITMLDQQDADVYIGTFP